MSEDLTLAIGNIVHDSGAAIAIASRARDAVHLHVECLIAEVVNERKDNHC